MECPEMLAVMNAEATWFSNSDVTVRTGGNW